MQASAMRGIYTIQSVWELPHQPFFTSPTNPLVTANAMDALVFCLFQSRSVTDEQHVRSHAQKELVGEIISAGSKGGRSEACDMKKILMFNSIYILHSDGRGS